MIDVFAEELLSFRDAAKIIPGRPHLLTLHRWSKEGLRGVHLETVLVGGTRFTTKSALNAFFSATAQAITNGDDRGVKIAKNGSTVGSRRTGVSKKTKTSKRKRTAKS